MLLKARAAEIGDEVGKQILSGNKLLDQFVFAEQIGVVDGYAVQAAIKDVPTHRLFLRQ